MFDRVFAMLSRFRRDEHASLVAETVLILPVLVWWYVGSLVFFHGYEARNVNMKAAYTIADMISRTSGAVGPNYINGLDNIFDYLTDDNGSNGRIRVTLLRCSSNCDRNNPARTLEVDWSYGTGGLAPIATSDMGTYAAWIPVSALGDRLILLETMVDYVPAWGTVGLDVDSFVNRVVTRPRFAPQIPWDPAV